MIEKLKSRLAQYAPLLMGEHDDLESDEDLEKTLSSLRPRRWWLPWAIHGLLFTCWIALFAVTRTSLGATGTFCRDELYCEWRSATAGSATKLLLTRAFTLPSTCACGRRVRRHYFHL